jgi:uncharacterized phage protein (TIGR02218 family)
MRTLPPDLAASLQSGVTTLCWCWRVARRDGSVLGFTEHDRDLVFDGVAYVGASARASGAAESEASFAGGTAAIAGVLDNDAISEAELAKGLYDGAEVRLFRVDWTDSAARVLVWTGFLGEITRGETGFEAELRSRQAVLERSIGRVFQRRCDAILGDARCRIDLDQAAFRATGAVTAIVDSKTIRVSGLAAFANGWLSRGTLRWASGANAGAAAEIEAHRAGPADASLELLAPPPAPVLVGDAFSADAGCDKRWATCKAKFANTVNFRGFPMIPGDDWLAAGPREGDLNDGGSLWTDRDA